MEVNSSARLTKESTLKEYNVRVGDRRVTSTVTDSFMAVDGWLSDLMHESRFDENLQRNRVVGLCLGLYTEGNHKKIGTINLLCGNKCLIFQVLRAKGLSRSLRSFLMNGAQGFTFVG